MVPIIMGSGSDYKFVKKIGDELDIWKIPYEYEVRSGHKTPRELLEYLEKIEREYHQIVYETSAGRSNALSGVVAANTRFPVIACPPHDREDPASVVWLQNDIWSSLDMPGNVPVATILDPKCAALEAVRIFALSDQTLAGELEKYQEDVKRKVLETKLE